MKIMISPSFMRYMLFFFLLCIGSIIIGYLVQVIPLIKAFDAYWYITLDSLPHTHLINTLISPFVLWFFPGRIFFLPAYFYLLVGCFLLIVFFIHRKQFLPAFFTILVGFILVGILFSIDYHFIFRHRPFDSLPNHVDQVSKVILRKSPSFPSGHTRDTTLCATIISYFLPRLKWFMIAFVAFIAFTRVYTGQHYPTDVLAGILFGFIVGKIAIGITPTVMKKLHVIKEKNEYEEKE